jgi:hypothetical protein
MVAESLSPPPMGVVALPPMVDGFIFQRDVYAKLEESLR